MARPELVKTPLGQRLKEARGDLKRDVFARLLDISERSLGNYERGDRVPDAKFLQLMAVNSGINVNWLLTGNGPMKLADLKTAASPIQIPRYGVQLSAGDGHWNEDELTPLDYIPFTKEFLQKKLGRKSTNDLLILEASGDSMVPTIAEDDLVLVDQRMKVRTDGVYAFIQDGLARVKRFRFMAGGKVQIVSDNREIYPPETLSNEEAEYLHIIGRVRWIGHTV
jgi:phage repressor protein C with HTH and peptisase S24 domain